LRRSLASSKALSWLNKFLAGTVAGALGAVEMTAGLKRAGGTDWCRFAGLVVAETDTRKNKTEYTTDQKIGHGSVKETVQAHSLVVSVW
jgi:hypothetical protein